MRPVAYLVNRYPEATLTAIRREIEAVEAAGVPVVRFAHRPSDQPFADSVDQSEGDLTEYVALAGYGRLVSGLLRTIAIHPVRFARALLAAVSVEPFFPRAMAYLALACLLQQRLETHGVATLHVHFGLSSAAVGVLIRELGGPPWCVTIHGPEEFAPENRKRLSRVARSANQTIAISEWAATALRQAASPVAIRPQVIGMGVGSKFLSPPQRIDAEAPIVCIARLDARKGHAVLLDALVQLADAHRKVRIELIGDGPLRAQIESQVSHRGLASSVFVRGWLSELAVKEALDRSRFLVLPSLDEGLPVAIMEAFARARPVLATRVAGIPELVVHGFNGVVVAPNDAAGLARGLVELLAMATDDLYRLGLNGRKLVEERFDSARNARSLIATWQEVGAPSES
jgi:colanic acid/amylovoran biosynthesis glycosyltransferase